VKRFLLASYIISVDLSLCHSLVLLISMEQLNAEKLIFKLDIGSAKES
jgi:hypothetical protein